MVRLSCQHSGDHLWRAPDAEVKIKRNSRCGEGCSAIAAGNTIPGAIVCTEIVQAIQLIGMFHRRPCS